MKQMMKTKAKITAMKASSEDESDIDKQINC